MIVINSAELVADISNDRKFPKALTGPFTFIRQLARDGLFTVSPLEYTTASIWN